MAFALEVHDSVTYPNDVDVRRACRKYYPSPPKLLVSEFADEHLIITSGPLAPGRWQTSFMPYQRGILDAFFEPGVQYVVFQASSQVGKTSSAVVLVAYHIAHDPCTILVVEPTVDPMAKDFSVNRLEPIVDASPVLEELVSQKRAKNSQNTILSKTFKGGSISIGGANSAASLAARTIRFLVLDEIDRYPPELPGEGSTIQIAIKRTTTFGSEKRVFLSSSPTLRGGPIDVWYRRGDQRRYYVPCPKCGFKHTYQWRNVVWDDRDPSTARLECPECKHPISNAERVAALDHGEWRAENPDHTEKSIVSFHIWEAYSPLSSLEEIVSAFLAANEAKKAGDASLLHTWMNTSLGEAIEPVQGEGVESHVLMSRRETWGDALPDGVVCVTMGVDVQDDRLEALVFGWGLGEESWLIDRAILSGDTSQPSTDPSMPGPWKMLDELLEHTYLHPTGQRLGIAATCIDSGGHRTERVYDYAARHTGKRVFAIVGRSGERAIVSTPSSKGWGNRRRKVPIYTIGTDPAKAILMDRLKLQEPGPGFIHIPNVDWFDEELAKQLTSERLVTKMSKGIPTREWRRIRARNEGLDCAVYGLGAMKLLHPDFEYLAEVLRNPQTPPPAPPPRRDSWMGGRRRGWFR